MSRIRLWVATVALASSIGGCGDPNYAEMEIRLTGLRAALGSWSTPQLVSIVVYVPRPSGAPAATVRYQDPNWNDRLEDRRISSWDGNDAMTLTVAWWRGPIDSVRVHAVIATGQCGADRTVVAEGRATSIGWTGQNDRPVAVTMTTTTREVYTTASAEGCR